ncbi:GIY-YIG nuclease family protein [Ramlibacter sp. AW1]|uniref:GIY-YIG nuclease family protein n=1 Tax=Ramlibacter aurantiacus TaxID=2801330 RepID=A0A937D6J7_9BURK|nr:GIY-YIG nuclease family protein [Ramlibacter aurantiacus]MBL0422377.1 GIY-YIG nuclease family protein [Ramlibacter aurantiacus]
MDGDATSLRQKMVAVLTQSAEPLTYRSLTKVIWESYPDFHQHMLSLYDGDPSEARRRMRIRMGIEVREHPEVFAATKVEGVVVVGLAATEDDAAIEVEEEKEQQEAGVAPAIYWYTFPAYKRSSGPYPIKIGKGANPEARIMQQVTPMPEKPEILGTYPHPDADNLEKAIQYLLKVRGRRKADAPGAEWFVTTPQEVLLAIQAVLGTDKPVS